jgi:hypothetical protein
VSQNRATEQSPLFLEKAMSNRSRDAGVRAVLGDIVDTVVQGQPQTAHTLAIVASINRLVKIDGSLSGGRACVASVRAASWRIQPSIASSKGSLRLGEPVLLLGKMVSALQAKS